MSVTVVHKWLLHVLQMFRWLGRGRVVLLGLCEWQNLCDVIFDGRFLLKSAQIWKCLKRHPFLYRKCLITWNLLNIYFSKCSLWKRDNWINFDQSFFLLRSTKKLAIFKKINNMHTKLLFVDKWFVFKGCNHLKLARMLLYLVFPVKPILKVTFFEWMLVWGELKDHRKILSIKPE